MYRPPPDIDTSPLLRRYASFVVQHHWLVLGLVIAVTIALGFGAAAIHVEVDPDRQLPQDHPYIQALNETHRLFGDKNLVMVGLLPTSGDAFSPAFLAKTRQITEALASLPGAVAPLLQSIASPAVKYIALEPAGLVVTPLMPATPLSESDAREVKRRVFADQSYVGTLVSFDGSAVALYASFELTPSLPGYVNLHRAIVDVLEDANDGTFAYALSGPVVIASSLSIYANQVAYFFPIALLIIGIVHYDAFRTWQAIFLPLTTGLLAVVWSLGLMGHLRVPLDPFNATTPVLILAIGAGHAVQILKRYYEEYGRLGDNDAAIIESMTRVGSVMIAAGTIAALSFASLATLGTASMRTFGLFTAFGIFSALVIELTTIPALRAILPPPSSRDWHNEATVHPRIDRVLRYATSSISSPRGATVVLLAYLLAIVISTLLARRIHVDTSLKRTFASTDPIYRQDDILNGLFGGTNVLLFTVEGPQEGAIAQPAVIQAIDSFQRRIAELPGVGKVVSVVDTLRRLHRAIDSRSEFNELPESSALIAQYLFLYTLSGGNDLSTKLTPDNRITKIVAMLREDSTQYGERTIGEALRISAEELPSGYRLRVSGTLASNAALTATMVRGKILNVLQIALITIVVAGLVLRSWLGGLLVAAPLAIAVIVNLGVMGALDLPLDISSAVVTAMAVGIGADYAVYFLFRLREEFRIDYSFEDALRRTMTTSGKAVIFVSSAVALGYSVLCLSGFRIFVQLGSLVGLAMVTSSLATLLVLPALLTMIARTNWIRRVLGVPKRTSPSSGISNSRASTGN